MDSDVEERYDNDLDISDEDSMPTPALTTTLTDQKPSPFGMVNVFGNKLSLTPLAVGEYSMDLDEETRTKLPVTPSTCQSSPRLAERTNGDSRIRKPHATVFKHEERSIKGNPIVQCAEKEEAHVYVQAKASFQNSLFGPPDVYEENTAYGTDVGPTDLYRVWTGGIQDTRGLMSSGYFSGSRLPPQTGVPMTEAQLREGGGRRFMDPSRCPLCNRRIASVTQLPCGHIVCNDCSPSWEGETCYVCGHVVTKVAKIDPYILQ